MNFTEFPQEDVIKAVIELVEQNKFGPAYPPVMYNYDKTEEWIAWHLILSNIFVIFTKQFKI